MTNPNKRARKWRDNTKMAFAMDTILRVLKCCFRTFDSIKLTPCSLHLNQFLRRSDVITCRRIDKKVALKGKETVGTTQSLGTTAPHLLEAQQRYFSYRAILLAIASQNSVVLVSMGCCRIIARYAAKWGIAERCLCETKCQGGGYRTILGEWYLP